MNVSITILDVTIWSNKDNDKLAYKVKDKRVSVAVYDRYLKTLKRMHKNCDVIINTTENPGGLKSEPVWINKVNANNDKLKADITSLKNKIVRV